VRMLRSSSTKAIVGMSLLSETEWLNGVQSSDAPHEVGFERSQRAMQAGLKCDRVPLKCLSEP
jgi:hypothetical protein